MTAPHTLTPAAPQRSPRARHWLAPTRRAATAVAMGAALCLAGASAWAAGTMRVAMTLSDIPVPNGQTDQGAEGMRFIGYTVFEALVAFDLSSADRASGSAVVISTVSSSITL